MHFWNPEFPVFKNIKLDEITINKQNSNKKTNFIFDQDTLNIEDEKSIKPNSLVSPINVTGLKDFRHTGTFDNTSQINFELDFFDRISYNTIEFLVNSNKLNESQFKINVSPISLSIYSLEKKDNKYFNQSTIESLFKIEFNKWKECLSEICQGNCFTDPDEIWVEEESHKINLFKDKKIIKNR